MAENFSGKKSAKCPGPMGGLGSQLFGGNLAKYPEAKGGHVSELFKEQLLSALGLIWAKGGPYTELFGGKLC